MLATLFKEPHLASVLMSTTYQMSTLGSTVGQHDPVAVVSKARESLRALREAQVIESVTQCSGIACNVATVKGTIALEPTRGTADMSPIATSISDTTVQAFMDQFR